MDSAIHFITGDGSNRFIVSKTFQETLRENETVGFHIKLPRIDGAFVYCHIKETLLHFFIRNIPCGKCHTGNRIL